MARSAATNSDSILSVGVGHSVATPILTVIWGEVAERGDDLRREGVRVARRRGVRLVAVARRSEQRGAKRLQLELRDRGVEHAEQRGVLRVLRPVVDDEQRQQCVGLDAVRRPDETVDVRT